MNEKGGSRASYVLVLIGLMFLFAVASDNWPRHAHGASPRVSGEAAKLAILAITVVAVVKLVLLHAPSLFGSLTNGRRRRQARPSWHANHATDTRPDRWNLGKDVRGTQD